MKFGDALWLSGSFSKSPLRCRVFSGLKYGLLIGLLKVGNIRGADATTTTTATTTTSTAISSSSSSSASSCSSSGRRLGSSSAPWWCEEWERDHLEASSAAAMIVVALAFEHLYHHLLHKAEHSFVYGQSMLTEEEKKAAVNRSVFGKPLRLILLARMGGEFMVLGFLAFTIWTSNQQNLFLELANMESTSIRLPTSSSVYLHTMEEVHMQLFVAMILYFALCFKVVLGVDERIKEYEHNRTAWVEQIMNGTANSLDTDAKSLREFKMWRGHFLDGAVGEILGWREGQPETFTILMTSMHVQKDAQELTLDDMKDMFTARFSFCSYLVFSVCGTTITFVNISHYTMIAIICCKGLFAILHRAGHVELRYISPVLSGLCFIWILTLFYLTRLFRKCLNYKETQTISGFGWLPDFIDRTSHFCDPLMIMLVILQTLLFFLCHTWSGNMISKDFWNAIFQRGEGDKIATAIIYILALCALAYMLPKIVPDFAAVMSLPPFFSYSNREMVKLVAIQVVDAKMVAAREAMKKRLEEKATEEEKQREEKEQIRDALQPKALSEPKDQEESPSQQQSQQSQPFLAPDNGPASDTLSMASGVSREAKTPKAKQVKKRRIPSQKHDSGSKKNAVGKNAENTSNDQE